MVTEEVIRERYEFYFSKVTGYRDYCFTPTINQNKVIGNFLAILRSKPYFNSLGDDFINDYFSFHFGRKTERKTRFGDNIVPLNHVIGPKALKEWEERDEHYKFFILEFREKFNIVLNKKKNKLSLIKSVEEEERKRFFNTEKGIWNCIMGDIIFDHKSRWCVTCKFKNKCREREI